jgi:hypothetical protein
MNSISGNPIRVVCCYRLDSVDGKHGLKVERLLGPESSVVVEHGDSLSRRDKVCAAVARDPGDEIGDRLLGRAFVPRRQGVVGTGRCRGKNGHYGDQGEHGGFHRVLLR